MVFAGYEQLMTLSEVEHDGPMSQTWNIIQLKPGGALLIATFFSAESSAILSFCQMILTNVSFWGRMD